MVTIAAAISATVYNERDCDYWYKYFAVQQVKDNVEISVASFAMNQSGDFANTVSSGQQPRRPRRS